MWLKTYQLNTGMELNFNDNLQTAKRKSPKKRNTCLTGILGDAARPTSWNAGTVKRRPCKFTLFINLNLDTSEIILPVWLKHESSLPGFF
jgi:hypothetical protein